jgi:hypothetical protein
MVELIYWEQNGEVKKDEWPARYVLYRWLRGDYIPHGRARPINYPAACGKFLVETIDVKSTEASKSEWETYTVAVWEPDFGYGWSEVKIFKGLIRDEWL